MDRTGVAQRKGKQALERPIILGKRVGAQFDFGSFFCGFHLGLCIATLCIAWILFG